MSFSRLHPPLLRGEALDGAMRTIGMRIGRTPATAHADIEATLASVAVDALPHDYRLFGVLAAWLERHHAWVNVPRLKRFAKNSSDAPLVRAWWSAVGTWLGRDDPRWHALEPLHTGTPIALEDEELATLRIARVGADPRFEGTALIVDAKLLRSRSADVDTVAQVAARHPVYRKRIEFGPNYRADVWSALDAHPDATPAEVARVVLCAYETARSVAADWHLFHAIRASVRGSAPSSSSNDLAARAEPFA